MADLGSIRFPHLGATATATLRDDRSWRLDGVSPDLEEMIRDALGRIARQPHGPSHGFYGPRQLREAAKLLGGTVTDQVEPEGEPGRIY